MKKKNEKTETSLFSSQQCQATKKLKYFFIILKKGEIGSELRATDIIFVEWEC